VELEWEKLLMTILVIVAVLAVVAGAGEAAGGVSVGGRVATV
jgi:hypothetical protein